MRDAIEMAREAGFMPTILTHWALEIERFAALVRADEREACAKVAEDSDHIVGGRGYHDQLGDADATARNITAVIRARGQA